MGKCKKPTTQTQLGWEPYVYGNGNTVCTYDPYRQTLQCGPPTLQQYNQQQQMSRRSGVGAGEAQKLDKMTRSRNALIITTIVLVAFGLACFIAVMVLAFSKESDTTATTTMTTVTTTTATTTTAADTVNIAVISTITKSSYIKINEADLTDTSSYTYDNLQDEFCVEKITPAAKTAATVNSCTMTTMTKSATASVTGTATVNVNSDGSSNTDRLTSVKTKIEAAATIDSEWTTGEITLA